MQFHYLLAPCLEILKELGTFFFNIPRNVIIFCPFKSYLEIIAISELPYYWLTSPTIIFVHLLLKLNTFQITAKLIHSFTNTTNVNHLQIASFILFLLFVYNIILNILMHLYIKMYNYIPIQ